MRFKLSQIAKISTGNFYNRKFLIFYEMAEESKKFWLFFFEVFGGRTRKFLPRKLNETYAKNDRPFEASKSCGWKFRPLLAEYDSLFVGWSIYFGILKTIAINEELTKKVFLPEILRNFGFFFEVEVFYLQNIKHIIISIYFSFYIVLLSSPESPHIEILLLSDRHNLSFQILLDYIWLQKSDLRNRSTPFR